MAICCTNRLARPGRCHVLAQSADLAAEDIAATLVVT
jgi:hypothetical protein